MGNNCKGICYSNESASKSITDNLDNINIQKSKHNMSRRMGGASNSGNNFSKNFDSKNIKVGEDGVR